MLILITKLNNAIVPLVTDVPIFIFLVTQWSYTHTFISIIAYLGARYYVMCLFCKWIINNLGIWMGVMKQVQRNKATEEKCQWNSHGSIDRMVGNIAVKK